MERKLQPAAEIKLATDDPMQFSGYGAYFGNVDGDGDVIAPGAFAKTIADFKNGVRPWPAMLLQHGMFGAFKDITPIGVWIDIAEDGVGLRVEGRLADTPRGREAATLLAMTPRPALDGLSIGYRALRFSTASVPKGARRRLDQIDLSEVSLVTFPANTRARVDSAKSLTLREFEAELRDAFGFTRSEAEAVAAQGFKAIAARDAGADHDGILQALQMLQANLKG